MITMSAEPSGAPVRRASSGMPKVKTAARSLPECNIGVAPAHQSKGVEATALSTARMQRADGQAARGIKTPCC